jgi:hypothetical protein
VDGTGFAPTWILLGGLNRVDNAANEAGHFRSRLHFFVAHPNWSRKSHPAHIIASKPLEPMLFW